jgi:LPS-assembly lipoprotein
MMTRFISALALVALLGLSGCGFYPLYATGGDGHGVAADLSGVAIPEAETRLGQIVRDDLLSGMRPAGTASQDRYTLTLKDTSEDAKIIEQRRPKPQRASVNVTVSFTLSEGSTKLLEGKTFSEISYDDVGEPFADQQAKQNAMERAAHEISGDIRTRLAAYFASHPGGT